MLLDRSDGSAFGNLPQPRGAVIAGRRHELSVRAEYCRANKSGMRQRVADRHAGFRLPKLNLAVQRQEMLAVSSEGVGADGLGVGQRRPERLAGGDVPEASFSRALR